jgi:Chain length determinant protein
MRFYKVEMDSYTQAKPRELMPNTNSDFDRAAAFLWRRRWLLSILIAVGAVAGAGLSYCFTPLYKADALLIPSDEMLGLNAASGALGGLGSLGGLASLVGIGGKGDKESEAIETLKSRGLTTSYIESKGLMLILFHDRWDPVARKWRVGSFGHAPTLEDGYRIFDKSIRTVVENRKTGLTTISVTWEDPILAKQWTDGLVDAVNDLLRTQAIERTTRNLDYLRKAADATNITEVRATIYKLMETEIKKQMVAYGGKDYAFRVVDPAVVPERKDFPHRALFLLGGAIVCPILGFLLIALRDLKGRVTQ